MKRISIGAVCNRETDDRKVSLVDEVYGVLSAVDGAVRLLDAVDGVDEVAGAGAQVGRRGRR